MNTQRKSEPTGAGAFVPVHLLPAAVPMPPPKIEPISELEAERDALRDALAEQRALLVTRFDAPPYTLRTLQFSTQGGPQSAILECGSAVRALEALRRRLTPELGASVAPEEAAALACLRRDLQVQIDRLTELMRSIARITQEDVV